MAKTIVFTGPESSGKTFLSNYISQKFDWPLVIEYAREYLNKHGPEYDLNDLKKIEEGQQQLEKNDPPSSDIIIQDTDFLTLWIWYTYKYNVHPDRVYNYLQRNKPHHYFLCYPDIEWEEDELRENPNDRVELYFLYKREIERLAVPYTVVKGSFKERRDQISSVIEEII